MIQQNKNKKIPAGQAARLIELNQLNAADSAEPNLFLGKPKIAAFGSGKGGTGKSFISLNTALLLSAKKKVLFVDLDLNLSNIHIMLDRFPEKTISSFFEEKCSMAGLICRSDKNIHFIFGDSGNVNHPDVSISSIEHFFSELYKLGKDYDFIILDTGSGIGENTINILYKSDISILVANPEPTSIMDAYVVLKILKTNSYKGYKAVVINKCGSETEGRNAFVNLNSASVNFLKEELNLLGVIDYNKEIIQAVIDQTPFVNKYRSTNSDKNISRSILQISTLAAGLVEIQQMANIHQS